MKKILGIFVLIISFLACPNDKKCTQCTTEFQKTISSCKVCVPWAFNDKNTGTCVEIPELDLYSNCLVYQESFTAIYRCQMCKRYFGLVGFERNPCQKCQINSCTSCEFVDEIELCNECEHDSSPDHTKKQCLQNNSCTPNCDTCKFDKDTYICSLCKTGFVNDKITEKCEKSSLENCKFKYGDMCVECFNDAYITPEFTCIKVVYPYNNSWIFKWFSRIFIFSTVGAIIGFLYWRLRNEDDLNETEYKQIKG